jgi:hypothetical protein
VADCADLVRALYSVVAELERRFPGRPFTPDGHLVGSIGEVLAASRYELKLLPCSTALHDAVASDGRLVQIKATQGIRVSFYGKPENLIVLKLLRDGTAQEIYNGPGEDVWAHVSGVAKNGQCSISVSKLRSLMLHVPSHFRIREAMTP